MSCNFLSCAILQNFSRNFFFFFSFCLLYRPQAVFSILKWLLMSWCNWRHTRSWLPCIHFQHSPHSGCAAIDNNSDFESRSCSGKNNHRHTSRILSHVQLFVRHCDWRCSFQKKKKKKFAKVVFWVNLQWAQLLIRPTRSWRWTKKFQLAFWTKF